MLKRDASYPNRTSDLVITVRVTRLTTGPRRLDVYLWYTVGDARESSMSDYITFGFRRGGQAEYANQPDFEQYDLFSGA